MRDLERSSSSGARIDAQILRAARGVRAPLASRQRLRRRTWWLLVVSFASSTTTAAAAAVSGNAGWVLLVAGSASVGAVWYGVQDPTEPLPLPGTTLLAEVNPPAEVERSNEVHRLRDEPSEEPALEPAEVSLADEPETRLKPAQLPSARKRVPTPKRAAKAEPVAVALSTTETEETEIEEAETETVPDLPTSQPESTLSAEVALIRQARAQLKRQDYRACRATLNEHHRRFRPSVLALEAEVIRIQALAGSGSTRRAKSRARRFLAQHPTGLAAERVRPYASD